MLRLTRWIAEYYLCTWSPVLEAVIPAGVRDQAGTRRAPLLSVAPEAAGRWRGCACRPSRARSSKSSRQPMAR